MNDVPANTTELPPLKCPTCGATQPESHECRRCKCDLTLVIAVRRRMRQLHEDVLRHLHQGNVAAAVRTAKERSTLAVDQTAVRLLAVSYLAAGDFASAKAIRDAL